MNLSFLLNWHNKTLAYTGIYPANMKQEILNKVEACFKTAEKYFNTTFERPKQIIFKRSGTTGGYSNYAKRELMFQLDLAENNSEDFLNQTVPHEVAHYVQRAVYGYKRNNMKVMPHGYEWKYIMRNVYGLNPERCHHYDTSGTKTKRQVRHLYTCSCGKTYNLSSTLHNRIQKSINEAKLRGYANPLYRRVCLSCRTTITLVQDEATILMERMKTIQKLLDRQKNLV